MSCANVGLETYFSTRAYEYSGVPASASLHCDEHKPSDDAHSVWELALLDGLPHGLPFTPHSYTNKMPSASTVARFLQCVLNPGMLAATAMLGNSIGGSISSAAHPFKPATLRDYMVEVYHELFCITRDPNTPINPAIWKLEQRVLVAYAKQRMLDYNKAHPEAPQTPTLPTGPTPITPPAPGQAPVPPCCAGGNLVATLRRQGGQKGGGGAKADQSLNA